MNDFENFIKEKKTIDLVKANIYSILGIIPVAVLYFLPFYFIWEERFTLHYLRENLKTIDLNSNSMTIAFLAVTTMIIGIILHEIIHGLTWAIFTKNRFKSMMPSIILGLLPSILAIILGNIILLTFGGFFTIAAFGDFMIINLIKNENKNSYVLDHPSEAGCFIFRERQKPESPIE